MAKAPALILVTTDLSPLGDAALAHAVDLARGKGARVVLLSVVETPPPPSPLYAHYYPTPKPEQIEQARAQLGKELEQRAARLRTAGVPIEIEVRDGDPATEIVRAALDHSPAAVVISTHGRTGLKHFLLGSVAERVVKSTTCPVLLVR